ncbi:MAG: hypothetical protein F6K18_09095 [Okeania sp. SIO2C2]|nr:hypothetical protein [Okeania sp. SIO2C2]
MYADLKPVISLTIADFIMFQESEKIITHFAFKEWDNYFVYPDSDLELFFVELPKFKKKLANLETMTDKWLYFIIFFVGLIPHRLHGVQNYLGERIPM